MKSFLCLLSVSLLFTFILIYKNNVFKTLFIYISQDVSTQYEGDVNLLLGSSSISRLTRNDLKCGVWLNRGIGNSTISDIVLYISLTPLSVSPDKILIYAGENDISKGEKVTLTIKNYRNLILLLLTKYPESEIHINSIKLSPARRRFWKNFLILNKELVYYADRHEKVFIHQLPSDFYELENIFLTDGLHFSNQGTLLFMKGINEKCKKK